LLTLLGASLDIGTELLFEAGTVTKFKTKMTIEEILKEGLRWNLGVPNFRIMERSLRNADHHLAFYAIHKWQFEGIPIEADKYEEPGDKTEDLHPHVYRNEEGLIQAADLTISTDSGENGQSSLLPSTEDELESFVQDEKASSESDDTLSSPESEPSRRITEEANFQTALELLEENRSSP
jgi:hypothetical protein